MPKLNKSKAIAATLNRDRRVRTSSRKVCSPADSPVSDSREVDSLAFSGSIITSFGDGLWAGAPGRGCWGGLIPQPDELCVCPFEGRRMLFGMRELAGPPVS